MNSPRFEAAPKLSDAFARHSVVPPPPKISTHQKPPEVLLPEKPSEKQYERHLTPGGPVEQAVHAQLDDRARWRIYEHQRDAIALREQRPKPLTIAQAFEQASRNEQGWDPKSQQEYESWSNEQEAAQGATRFSQRPRLRDEFEQQR